MIEFNEDGVAYNCCGWGYNRSQWENVKEVAFRLTGRRLDDESPMCPDCWITMMAQETP